MNVVKYEDSYKSIWNEFNKNSKNGIFMFDRSYMDYHKDRFRDHSLLFFKDKELIALLPLNDKEDSLFSHGGLTYGGFITSDIMKQNTMCECFDSLVTYASSQGYKNIYYKRIPHIFCKQPSEEDRYALFLKNANIFKIEPSTVIDLQKPIKMTKGRKAQISRARREGVIVKECCSNKEFSDFIDLENLVLKKYHNTSAVHSGTEISLLASRFPENIRLYAGYFDNRMISGSIIYEYENAIHTQYMAANDSARKIGALDYVISYIIEKYKATKKWLDFGISTENNGLILNQGLASQKESFGGRCVTYETWKLIL